MREVHGWFAEIVTKMTYFLLPGLNHRPIPAPVQTNGADNTPSCQWSNTGHHGKICRKILLGNYPLGHRRCAGCCVDCNLRHGA